MPGMTAWKEMRPEFRINEHSRCDFWMREARGQHYVEVKNCHLVYPDRRGYFPDSVSDRAAKHLRELSELVAAGHKATVLFVVQRADARSVRPSDAHDPAFATAAREAQAAGVRFRALLVRPTVEALIVEKLIPADIKPYATTRTDRWRAQNRALAPAWETRKRAGQN
jgi:sugar fermentation stimulation protein A